MDDMKDKVKVLITKVNNPFSSSGKFKGQGRILGSSSSGPSNHVNSSSSQHTNSKKSQNHADKNSRNQRIENKPETRVDSVAKTELKSGYDQYGERNPNGNSLNVSNSKEKEGEFEVRGKLKECVGVYISGKPSHGSVEVVVKLLTNVVKEPGNVKFRKIRMGNPKIKEAIADVAGAVELLKFVGFELEEESGEMWAVMDVPSDEQLLMLKNVVSLLEPKKVEKSPLKSPVDAVEPAELKPIDRQIRVFFSVLESMTARNELPDSFFNLSREELKRDAEMRKKKMEESQLLITKSYREKQAKAARKKYTITIIRVQFPDGVVLQGVFLPSEPTSALYEFVKSALKEPSLGFELLHPVLVKRRVIPHFPAAGKRAITLEEEDLVPAAMLKLRHIETDSAVFTGLCNELLQISESLWIDSVASS